MGSIQGKGEYEEHEECVEAVLQARAKLLRVLPKHKYPQLNTLLQNETHPDGYTVDDIGPDHLRQKWAK